MIICPRCGYQAPDGSPWCPRCGYGCPYPMQQQQLPPQQMPAVYQPQPQQVPPQYDVYDLPPQPEKPKKSTKKRKKKKSLFKKILLGIAGVIGALFIGFVAILISVWNDEPAVTQAPTTNVETMYAQAVETAQEILILSATPTFTITPTATNTQTPTPTVTPTITPPSIPEGYQKYTVQDGDSCWSIWTKFNIPEDEFLSINNFSRASCPIGPGDEVLIPIQNQAPAAAAPVSVPDQTTYSENTYAQTGSGIRGSVAQDTSVDTCAVKVSNKGIYHCKNSPNYNTMKEYTCFSSQAAAEAAGYKMSGNMHGWCQE